MDHLSRAQSLAHLTASLLEPERAAAVETLGRRGFGRERLATLATSAQDLVKRLGGKQSMAAAEATRLEAEAVDAQKVRWEACRRMIRAAVATRPELARLWVAS